jgi:hypothetical protein
MEYISFYYAHIILNSVKYIMYLTLGYTILCILLNCVSFFFGYFYPGFSLNSYLLPQDTSAPDRESATADQSTTGADRGYISGHEHLNLDVIAPLSIQDRAEVSDAIYESTISSNKKEYEDAVEEILRDSSKSDNEKAMECGALRDEYQGTIDGDKRDVLQRDNPSAYRSDGKPRDRINDPNPQLYLYDSDRDSTSEDADYSSDDAAEEESGINRSETNDPGANPSARVKPEVSNKRNRYDSSSDSEVISRKKNRYDSYSD